MLTVPANAPLAKTGLEVVLGLFNAQLQRPLDVRHVDFSLLPSTSRLRIAARELSTHGELGIYNGVATIPYNKASLASVLPNPVLYQFTYPTTYLVLRQHLLSRYGMLLEQGEFALAGAPTHGLVDADVVGQAPNALSGVVRLTALPQSGRWSTGTFFDLIVVPTNGPQRLASLVTTQRKASLATLTHAGTPVDYP